MAKGVKTGGRQKGTPNRFTALKDAFLDAFESEELGGTQGLIDWAKEKENRKDFYALVARMLPKNVNTTIETKRSAREFGDDELYAIIEGSRQRTTKAKASQKGTGKLH